MNQQEKEEVAQQVVAELCEQVEPKGSQSSEASNCDSNQEWIQSGCAKALFETQRDEIAFLRKLTEDQRQKNDNQRTQISSLTKSKVKLQKQVKRNEEDVNAELSAQLIALQAELSTKSAKYKQELEKRKK